MANAADLGLGASGSEGRVGPYALLHPLARGAVGVVYRARHVDTGVEVALKTLHVADPAVLESLRREGYALSRIRHPGVVRILAHGVEAGFPWYAMELIEGGTLAELWRVEARAPPREREPRLGGDAPHGPSRRSLLLLERVCLPLAFLHGEGIVHRDLKPENIAIRGDADWPVLVDFGLIGRWTTGVAREALAAGGALVGTVDYIAPEQARGEYVDARADLYSLGCILYEAATGRPPFTGTAGEVLMKHLEERPLAPSKLVPALDPRLDALILRLLEKQPQHRLGFADDVTLALRAITGADADPEAERVAAHPARSYLYRPSFVGRQTARRTLTWMLTDARGGRGGLVALGGESGLGKTRFAMEVTRDAAARGFTVITGECLTLASVAAAGPLRGAPLAPLRPLLREVAHRCVRDGVEGTHRLLGRRAKILATYEPALRDVPGYDGVPDPQPLPAAGERARALGDLADVLTALARERPLLVVLDDLHWADDMTLALLRSLGEAFFERTPLLLLCSFRTEELGPALADLLASPVVKRIDLGRLERAEVGTMVSSMLAVDPPPRQLVHLVGRESEGNPFFVAEYLRAAAEADLLRRSPDGHWEIESGDGAIDPLDDALPLPSSLRELIARRLTDLAPHEARVIDAGAVLGRAFDLELARELAGRTSDEMLEAVRRLELRQVLEPAGRDTLRFTHDKLREVAYAAIPAPTALALHRKAAIAIERRAPATPRYAELAYHWERADVKEHAVRYLALGGTEALERGAHRDAHEMITRALALDDQMQSRAGSFHRAQWRRMLGVASFGIGDLEQSIRQTMDALTGLGEHVPQTTTGWAGVAAIELGRALWPGATRARRTPRRNVMHEAAEAAGQLATSYFYNAEALPATANLLRGLNRARRSGDDAIVVESCARLGYVSGALGLNPVARHLFRRAHAIAARTADARGRALALYLDAMYREFRGHWEACRSLAEEAAAILDDIGDHAEAETARAIASHGYFFAGQLDQARTLGLAILRSADERASKHHIGWGLYLAARCDVVQGGFAAAIARLEEARVLLEPLPDAIDIIICEGWLARALLWSGQTEAAGEVATILGRRIASGKRPAVGQCVDGFAGWADVVLARWQAVRDSTVAARAARRACRELQRFAWIFRLAVPAARRARAQAEWLHGRPGRALRLWRRSIASAHALAMPYEEARSHRALARVLTGCEEGARHEEAAQRLFATLGCAEADSRRM